MTDADRIDRNRARLAECHPGFRARLARVLAELQAHGFRPRIQDAWRSPEDQETAYRSGHSHVMWGFHNATTLKGVPEALAADVLDDNFPLNPTRAYLLALAREARAHGLTTGIDWDLPPTLHAGLNLALERGQLWPGQIGWDPTHVQITGITIAQAIDGTRPTLPEERIV